jgi:hypothetical protein
MAFEQSDLPDELQDGKFRPVEKQDDQSVEEILSALGSTIGTMRDDAVKAREASGIDDTWRKYEDAYLGIDDMNRHEHGRQRWDKPTSPTGPLTSNAPKKSIRSTAFVRLTSRYVDMGSAKICEITLPIDDKAFSLGPTPVPDLVKQTDSTKPLTDATGKQVFRPPMDGETSQDRHGMVPATEGDYAKAIMEMAGKKAEKAEKRIYDWMLEANYPAEMRKVLHDAARIGTGVLKAPFPRYKTSRARMNGKMVSKGKVVPDLCWVDPWNLYPDPSCGENIHDGDHIFECDKITPAKLKAKKLERTSSGMPIYIASQIDKVLLEGPNKQNVSNSGNTAEKTSNEKRFTIWYFTGIIKREQMNAMGAIGTDDLPDEVVDVPAIITMVNDTVIRATVNPLESGNFPYRVMPWSRRKGSWTGVGVGEQVDMPQRTVNAGTRALLNNAGKSAGSQTVIDRRQITPADDRWEMTPDKFWWLSQDATTDDIRKIFMSVEIPNVGAQLMAVIEYGFKLGEEATNIPLVTQGRDGQNTPKTFGQAELQNTNAHTLLRSVAYALDDCITEPVVTDLHEWLLLDDTVPEDEKGDFEINAKGSSAMVERAIQEEVLAQMLPLSKDPSFGWNPKKLAARFLKAKRIDPRDVEYTKEELDTMAKNPPPEDPVITAAKIRAASAEKVAASRDQTSVKKSELDVDRDTAYQEALNERARIMGDSKDRELELRKELEVFKENNSMKKELDRIKARLAEVTMELTMQKELAFAGNAAKQVAETKMEPVGRAPTGKAFQA